MGDDILHTIEGLEANENDLAPKDIPVHLHFAHAPLKILQGAFGSTIQFASGLGCLLLLLILVVPIDRATKSHEGQKR